MDALALLAQQADQSPEWWETAVVWISGSTWALGYEFPVRPLVGLPLLVLVLWLAALVLRTVLTQWLGALTAKTDSHLDDAFIQALSRTVFPVGILVALEALVASTRLGESPVARKVLVVVAIVVIAVVVARLLLAMVDAWIASRPALTPLGPPIRLAIKIAWAPLVLLTVLSAIDVEIIQFVTTLGVGSLAIALALQDTLSNVFAGVQLVVDQPIRAGDFVEVDQQTRGVVHEIGLRSTKIRTLNNNMIIVPNSLLATTVIVNNEAYDREYAHRFTIGLGYDSDSRHIQSVLEDVLDKASGSVEGILPGPHNVRFLEFGDSALVFRIEVRLAKYQGRRTPLSELHHLLHARLRDEGIEIPFPMRTVVMRSEDASENDAAAS